MKQKTKILLLLFLSSGFLLSAQYRYKRSLNGIKDLWHTVNVPNEVLCKLLPDKSDLRILGILPNKDTIEVPYIWESTAEKEIITEQNFTVINQSNNTEGQFITFEIKKPTAINRISIDFQEPEYDTACKLEGSNDQKQWFTILANARLISIENHYSQYRYNILNFKTVKFSYFRMCFKSKSRLSYKNAQISNNQIIKGEYIDYPPVKCIISEEKKNKQTLINIDFGHPVLVSEITIPVVDKIDFYRPYLLQAVTDSIKTSKGWKKQYEIISSGIISSEGNNRLMFEDKMVRYLQLSIDNENNIPLHYLTPFCKGPEYKIVGRFNEKADYSLFYANNSATLPSYDIIHFEKNIPANTVKLNLGKEEIISRQKKTTNAKPFIGNKLSLWLIISVLIVILGFFTLTMLKKK